MSKFAPADPETGLLPYIVVKTSPFDRVPSLSLVYAENLAAAKREYGWTRERHTSVSVRRATMEDVKNTGYQAGQVSGEWRHRSEPDPA